MPPASSLYFSAYSPRSGALLCIAVRSAEAPLLSPVAPAIVARIPSRPRERPAQKHRQDVHDRRGSLGRPSLATPTDVSLPVRFVIKVCCK